MPRRKPLQTNFSAGELAPDISAREDTEQYQNGAKSLLNRRCLIGGGNKRRPGTWNLAPLAGTPRAEDFVVSQDTTYVLIFGDARVDCYSRDRATGLLTAAGSVTGAPWTATIAQEMDYAQSGNTAFLTHTTMPTQVLTRTGVSTWATADFVFYVSGPRTEQPYFKVADDAITLAPSALTGSITLTVNQAWFVAGHVGKVVRYAKREALITAVAGDGLSATATVLETLPGTYSITVTSSANFTVNEEVEGATTGAKGLVTAIADATHLTVVLRDSMQVFAGTEKIVGPNADTAMSAISATTAAAIKQWDEQLFGSVHGYPACVTLHRNRLLFGGHPAVPKGLIASKNGNLYSFDIGDGSDGDGIFEVIGDAGASEIVALHSSEQLLVFTDYGPYYVPESGTNPFRPSSIAFYSFGSPWPVTASARPRAFDDGVLFLSGSVVIKARPTGDQGRSWSADEVSLLSSHIVSNPTRLAVVSNFGGGPERYAIIQNDDGTIAALQLVEAQKIRNMTPWTTTGAYTSVCAIGPHLYATSTRLVAGNTQYFLELFDQEVTLDLATEYATKVLMDAGVPTTYGATPVNVVVDNRYHLGTHPLATANPPAGPYVVGLFFESKIELLPPSLDDAEGSHHGEQMRLLKIYVTVRDSARFGLNGSTLSAYQVTDDLDAPPPLNDGPIVFDLLDGWRTEPTVLITQPDPLPLDVLAIKTLVAF